MALNNITLIEAVTAFGATAAAVGSLWSIFRIQSNLESRITAIQYKLDLEFTEIKAELEALKLVDKGLEDRIQHKAVRASTDLTHKCLEIDQRIDNSWKHIEMLSRTLQVIEGYLIKNTGYEKQT